jgi:translation elongation factor P/translation initiation factor 5A
MKLIKLTSIDGKKAIINTQNIAYFYERNDKESIVAFVDSEDYLTIPVTIEELEKKLINCGWLCNYL